MPDKRIDDLEDGFIRQFSDLRVVAASQLRPNSKEGEIIQEFQVEAFRANFHQKFRSATTKSPAQCRDLIMNRSHNNALFLHGTKAAQPVFLEKLFLAKAQKKAIIPKQSWICQKYAWYGE